MVYLESPQLDSLASAWTGRKLPGMFCLSRLDLGLTQVLLVEVLRDIFDQIRVHKVVLYGALLC